MLIECLAPAASGKSTITRKLKKHFHSPTPAERTIKCSHQYQDVREAFARAAGGLKDKVEYYEHRRLVKQLAQRLNYHHWAMQQDAVCVTSMGVLQCVADLFMKYDTLPSTEEVQELLNLMPLPNIVITIKTDIDTLVQRHIKRSERSEKEKRLYMTTDSAVILQYITKQDGIIGFFRSTKRIYDVEVGLLNNFRDTKSLFASGWWENFVERIEERL